VQDGAADAEGECGAAHSFLGNWVVGECVDRQGGWLGYGDVGRQV